MQKKINLVAASKNNLRFKIKKFGFQIINPKFLILNIFLANCMLQTANCFSQNYLWAKRAGGNSDDWGRSVTADASGNIMVTGYFESPSITFGTTVLTNTGSRDIFIVKYDGSGNVLWAKSAKGTGDDMGKSITTDASGNIMLTGYFASSSIIFETDTLTNASSGYPDIFILKYDGSGNVLWAKSAGGVDFDYGNSATVDSSGNIILTGHFYSPSISFGTTVLTNAGTDDVFIVKYSGSGNILWAKRAGGTFYDEGNSVTTDGTGNIIVTGFFRSSSITFGADTLTNANVGSVDIFIVKYDGNGNVLWAKSAEGTGTDYGNSVTADASGNIIVTGSFYSDSISFGTTTLITASVDTADIFLVKYDGSGNVLWAKRAGGTNWDEGNSVTTDASGNIIVTGFFRSSSITFGTTVLTNVGFRDIFIVKFNGSGNVLWAKGAGGNYYDEGNSVISAQGGNIIVTGYFSSSSISFGTTTLTANAGTDDIFLVKLNGATGIEDNWQSEGVNVFPNPTTGKFEVVGGYNEIKIYNVQGGKVFASALGSPISEIDLSGMSEGFYFVHIITTERQYNRKIVLIK